jgi:hypothetical protein
MENDNTPGDNLSVNANAHSTSQMAQEANPQQKRSRLIDQLKFAKKTGVLPKKEQTCNLDFFHVQKSLNK